MRVLAVCLAALLAAAAVSAIPLCLNSDTTYSSVNSGSDTSVCLGPCKNHMQTCFPTPPSLKYTETLFFTTFTDVQGSTVWSVDIAVDDSSYVADFATGSTSLVASTPAMMQALTVGSDGIIGHPFNDSIFIVSGQWTGHVSVINMITHHQYTVNTQYPHSGFTPYGTFHMMVTTDTSSIASPTFGKWWLFGFSGKYQGPILPEVPVGWWLNDDGTFGPNNFHVFSVVGDDTLITQIVSIPDSKGVNHFIYTSAPPQGGGYHGVAYIDFITYTITTVRKINPPFTDATGFMIPCHGVFYDTYTGDVLMFGAGQVAQVNAQDPSSPNFGLVNGKLTIAGEDGFDQGAPDGRGHLFLADNNNDIRWISYVRSGQISTPDSQGVLIKFNFLDDVAPLIGPGKVCPRLA